MKIVFFILLFAFITGSSFAEEPAFLCKTYEDELQNSFDLLLEENFNNSGLASTEIQTEDFLERIIQLLKDHNPEGENKLNYIVVGQSRSLQATRIDKNGIFPRIILKSPNSELLVAFNTHPEEKGYNSIEVIRWKGKEARYEFINFDFSSNKPTVDKSGKNCMRCHGGENLRPNWGSYKAWGGVLPSRDDMLEVESRHGQYLEEFKTTLETEAYLKLLNQAQNEKKNRLRLIDPPLNVEEIKSHVQTNGFYRIPHYPFKKFSSTLKINIDAKTAPLAGPSQMLFDQLLGQNMCRIAVREKELFRKYAKYILNFHLNESTFSFDSLSPKLVGFKQKYLKNYSEILGSYKIDHRIKNDQHRKMLMDYIVHFGDLGPQDGEVYIRKFLDFQQGPTIPEFNSSDDVGGLRGVKEKNTQTLAFIKTIFEAHDKSLKGWSLSQGERDFYSFSFSDQFELLFQYPPFIDIRASSDPAQ